MGGVGGRGRGGGRLCLSGPSGIRRSLNVLGELDRGGVGCDSGGVGKGDDSVLE